MTVKSPPRVGACTGMFKKPTKCIWRWEPDRRCNFFFSPLAQLCAVNIVDGDVKQPIPPVVKQKERYKLN